MKRYEECFGMQTPHALRFADGACIVVWAPNDELSDLSSLDKLGQKCLMCKDEYLCFELSRCRDLMTRHEVQVA